METVHFIGAAGAGVSALAQFHVMGGGRATGSDRAFDRGYAGALKAQLERLGVTIVAQDGRGLDARPDYAVASAAVEEGNADLARAEALGVPVLHRADCLARHVAGRRAIAVAGTSGKSTVVAMIYEILETSGLKPSVITGGALKSLEARGYVGNAFRGASDLLAVEADESDGTLTKYRPWLGVLLNISKDHKAEAEVRGMFRRFRGQCAAFAVRAEASLREFEPGSLTFGVGAGEVRAEGVALEAGRSRFEISGVGFELPVPGLHNVENAVAAVAACGRAGASLEAAARALRGFAGVARRFERLGSAGGVEVVDDFAHNPAKVSAALAAAHLGTGRVLAIFQLHGFAPARFMKDEFIAAFASALRSDDILWMPEIYYAGGTAAKDISAGDIAAAIRARGRDARFAPRRAAIAAELAAAARPGDVVLVMGARDPSLGAFGRDLLSSLRGRFPEGGEVAGR